MDLFVVDQVGDQADLEERECPKLPKKQFGKNRYVLQNKPSSSDEEVQQEEEEDEDDDDDGDYGDLPPAFAKIDISHLIPEPEPKPKDPVDVAVERFCRMIEQSERAPFDYDDSLSKTNVSKVLKKDGVTENIELQKTLPNPSDTKAKKLRKLEASKTKGKNWYNMPATELTEEVQRDLEVIQMRSVLDPKHFYKKNDLKALPKYFQVGKVLSSPLDHYSERGQKVSKKKTIVDELMADAQFQKFNKRKYTETLEEKKRGGYNKAHSKMKKLKKNK